MRHFLFLSQHLAGFGNLRLASCTNRSTLGTLLVPIGLRARSSSTPRCTLQLRWVCLALENETPNYLPPTRLRFCHHYTARRSVHSSPVEVLFAYFLQAEHLIPSQDMTNAIVRPLMEVCIVRRMVGHSRLFASLPKPRNEASVAIGRSSIHGCVGPWCLCL